ncbi:MAG: efflux RND transporter periplasmic adaptor subunit, partial [Candidatus Wallbacteria bacterium]|nr:efflux RND transporter periplasmic adaptor subunit [Candidatus Wallbacteria bacterium]
MKYALISILVILYLTASAQLHAAVDTHDDHEAAESHEMDSHDENNEHDEHGEQEEHSADDGHGHGSEDTAHAGEAPGVMLSEGERMSIGIVLAEAGFGTVDQALSLPGEVSFDGERYVHLIPRIPGVVKNIAADIGDTVKAGQVLAVLESRELAESAAAYLALIERAKLSRSVLERENELRTKKISSEEEFLRARSEARAVEIDLQLQRENLLAAGLHSEHIAILEKGGDLKRYELISPLDGIIVKRELILGSRVDESCTPFEIANLDRLWVNMSIYQDSIGKIQSGDPVI